MRRWLLALVPFAVCCGPDSKPLDCHAGPDFTLLLSAEYGPLPSDTVLRLHYGGRPADNPEELVLADPGTPTVLFCYVSDRNGQHDPSEPALGTKSASVGEAGAGGAAAVPSPVQALSCQLWTDGSASLEIVTQMYGTTSVDLNTKKKVCTVDSKVMLTVSDGGI